MDQSQRTITLSYDEATDLYIIGAMCFFALVGRVSPGIAYTGLLMYGLNAESARRSLAAFAERLDIESMSAEEAEGVLSWLKPTAQVLGLEPPPQPTFGELS